MRRETFLVPAAVIAAAGCGDSGGQRLSREQYASKADAICLQYHSDTSVFRHPSTLPGWVIYYDKLLPIHEKALDDLHRLRPPESEQATADRWIATEDKILADLKEVQDKAKANDLQGARAAGEKASRDDQRVNQLATALGMTTCNQG